MSLKTRVAKDLRRVFIRSDHFATEHTWNGHPFFCVTDDETDLKRKNNNVNDISWDVNTDGLLLYVREEDWPGKREPNEAGYFDHRYMRVQYIQNDMGMLTISLSVPAPKTLESEDTLYY